MSDEDLANYLDRFEIEDKAEPVKTPLGWKFWCQALALTLTAPVWGPVLLLFFGIDRIAQLWPKTTPSIDKPERTPRYGMTVMLANGTTAHLLLNKPPKRLGPQV